MHISGLRIEDGFSVLRVSAAVAWQETDRSPFPFFVETEARFAIAFRPDPNAFLVACAIPAWHAGERRLSIDGPLCPVLCSNIEAALAMLKSWYPGLGPAPEIVTTHDFKARRPTAVQAVSLLSCGIDSLATFRLDRLMLPVDHPACITTAIPLFFQRNPSGRGERQESSGGRLLAAQCGY